MQTTVTAQDLKTLQARARAITKKDVNGTATARLQIAKRCIADVKLFMERNPQHATTRAWEARYHLNMCGMD